MAIVLVVATAGCIGDSGDGEDVTQASPDDTDVDAAPSATNRTDDASTGTITWTNQTGYWTAGGHVQTMQGYVVGTPLDPVSVAPNATGLVVTVTWSATTPLSQTLTVELSNGNGEVLTTASGSSPLAVPLDGSDLGGASEVSIGVYPGEEVAGAWVDQEYAGHTAVFEGLPFDESRVSP